MNTEKESRSGKGDSHEEIAKQLRRINLLETRLPWIAVILALISMLVIMLEVFLRHQAQLRI